MATETSSPDYAFWTTGETNFTVVYSLGLFHEIDFTVNEGYRRIPYGGIEEGGLLFGHISDNRVTIDAFRPIECEHASGPSFVLSSKDIAKLREQIAGMDSDPDLAGLQLVGCFIAHTRGPLKLTEKELAVFEEFFAGPGKLTVLVKPERFQPTRFGFLVRNEKGQMQSDASQSAVILPLPGRTNRPADGSPVPSLPAPRDPTAASPVPAAPRPLARDTVASSPASKDIAASSPVAKETSAPSPVPGHTAPPSRVPGDTASIPPLRDTAPSSPVPANTALTIPAAADTAARKPVVDTPPAVPRQKDTRPLLDKALEAKPQPPAPFLRETGIVPPRTASAGWPRPTTPAPSASLRQIESIPVLPYDFPTRSETRRLKEARPSRIQFALVLMMAALLGCCVGYWAYLQLPSPIIPLTLRAQSASLVVSWPPNETRGISYAAVRIDDGNAVPLSAAEKAAGETAVPAKSGNIKIELIAHHWMRDSRGIVRFIRGQPGTSAETAPAGQTSPTLP
jgi:hypothetical protein